MGWPGLRANQLHIHQLHILLDIRRNQQQDSPDNFPPLLSIYFGAVELRDRRFWPNKFVLDRLFAFPVLSPFAHRQLGQPEH